jgi:hypothetical protein
VAGKEVTLPASSPYAYSPRGTHRVFYVSDPSTIARIFLPNPTRERDLREWIDFAADAGIDMYGQEIWSQGWTAYWESKTYEYDQRWQHQRFRELIDAGTQPVEILVDQVHKRGMDFIAGFRMNDGHAGHNRREGIGIATFIESNPQWRLIDPRPEPIYQEPEALDFSFEEVRDYTRGVIEEAATRFDIDGVELCFRDAGYFPLGTARERMDLMTGLLRGIRASLDERGRAAGRKLRLGARVFATFEECAGMGLDVPAWITEGILDFVCPMDVLYNDFNIPYPEWAALTRASGCMLYPGIHPWNSYRKRYQKKRKTISWATHRALAHTMYAAGADGVSSFNHFVSSAWGAPFYPHGLHVFNQLGDPARVARGERHYIYDSPWSDCTIFGEPGGKCGTGAVKHAKIELGRGETAPSGELPFQLYEDLDRAYEATLLFRGFGLSSEDTLEVRVNGKVIPDEKIRRTASSDTPGLTMNSQRIRDGRGYPCMLEGALMDARVTPDKPGRPFATRWFQVRPGMVTAGVNTLSITLRESDPEAKGEEVVIDEIEVFVEPK